MVSVTSTLCISPPSPHESTRYQGFSISHAINRIDLGGHDVTDYLMLLMKKAGYTFSTTAEYELVRQIKEECTYCRASHLETPSSQPIEYTLPDGKMITVYMSSLSMKDTSWIKNFGRLPSVCSLPLCWAMNIKVFPSSREGIE